MDIRFPSLSHGATHGYLLHSDWRSGWDRRGNRHVATWASQYETYGDRNVQHSAEYCVQHDRLGDYCASLAAYLIESNDADALKSVHGHWPRYHRFDRDTVRFLASIRHDSDKRRYYSAEHRKASASDSKRHDKRWDEVPSWANGDPKSVYALAKPSANGVLESMIYYDAICRLIREETGCYHGNAADMLELPEKYADDAFHALKWLVDSYDSRRNAEKYLECYKSNSERFAAGANDAEKALAATA